MPEITIPIEVLEKRTIAPPPDGADDVPVDGYTIPKVDGPLQLPALIYGAGVLSSQYHTDDHLLSQDLTRTIRLALRYGIRAFDTSRYYGPSEYVLGGILAALKEEFPRESYKIMTKCGRFGLTDFDYSPAKIRQSVLDSLERLRTPYLDTVYLHDIEFVATKVGPRSAGNHCAALSDEAAAYGLAEEDATKIRGGGDQIILDAVAELRKLKEEGLVKNIGVTAYPLPTLLRIAILIARTSEPLDAVLSYSHLTLQNSSFNLFAPHFHEHAKVKQIINASPLSMGLLTPSPPSWHPSPQELQGSVREALKVASDLPSLALGYTTRQTGTKFPLVIGLSNVREVHECVKIWREVHERQDEERLRKEQDVIAIFERSGYLDWSWASG